VIPLDAGDLFIAACLVLVAGGVSVALRLDLERRLAVAAVRTVIQLLLIGYVLTWIFGVGPLWLVPLVGVMTLVAGHAAVQRSSRVFPGATWRAFVTLVACGLLTTYTVTAVIIGVEPWYRPQYMIPLLGMVLGNGLTGISLCLDQLLETLAVRRVEIEMELALGATRWEAARDPVGQAVRKGMIPIINAMMVVGIVSLPGMMTGQILAGSDPLDAVKYQIVVMFMIAAATALGCISMSLLVYKRLFNARHQLDAELITRRAT
jgi:putative ABC transport system permease protein